MNPTKPTPILLLTAALILLTIGSLVLFTPTTLYASNNVMLVQDPNLLSEIRAPGGLLFAGGLFVLASVFAPGLKRPALGLSTLFLLSYGLARLVSMHLDGMPSAILIAATAVELAVGLLCLWTLIRSEVSLVRID